MLPSRSAVRRRLRASRTAALAGYRQVRRAGDRHRPLFVAGAMGSGTSLLALSLGSRFRVAGVAYESALEVSSRSFLRMAPVESHRSVADYEQAIQPRPGWSAEDGRRWLQRLYRANAERSLPDIVDKGPNVHLVRAGFLAQCFPDARFVLVVRDPVANIEGFRRKWPTFARAPLSENIGFYRRTHERFLELADSLGLDVAVVAYEDLVARYEGVLSELGQRFGLTSGAVVGTVAAPARSGGKGIRNVSEGRIAVLPGTNEPAYRDLDHEEVSLIRLDLGDLHTRLLSKRLSGESRPNL
ncbi:MAG: hypothetical protein AVDCRST_MAG76-954 [uncultured Acidimicrobiales bacterium]|uniref:Sulfotransferase n=1 Tax=uncultured Acidimicrobiales bacterium TaxID=310071 RepID=A0A6J4HIT2_9ACTN|nr:MAG: hypothetical protein AVDCRST_MAG76-954 [uncultured Acidimicrobiales bacterium]